MFKYKREITYKELMNCTKITDQGYQGNFLCHTKYRKEYQRE
jgi:hypothetical protein